MRSLLAFQQFPYTVDPSSTLQKFTKWYSKIGFVKDSDIDPSGNFFALKQKVSEIYALGNFLGAVCLPPGLKKPKRKMFPYGGNQVDQAFAQILRECIDETRGKQIINTSNIPKEVYGPIVKKTGDLQFFYPLKDARGIFGARFSKSMTMLLSLDASWLFLEDLKPAFESTLPPAEVAMWRIAVKYSYRAVHKGLHQLLNEAKKFRKILSPALKGRGFFGIQKYNTEVNHLKKNLGENWDPVPGPGLGLTEEIEELTLVLLESVCNYMMPGPDIEWGNLRTKLEILTNWRTNITS